MSEIRFCYPSDMAIGHIPDILCSFFSILFSFPFLLLFRFFSFFFSFLPRLFSFSFLFFWFLHFFEMSLVCGHPVLWLSRSRARDLVFTPDCKKNRWRTLYTVVDTRGAGRHCPPSWSSDVKARGGGIIYLYEYQNSLKTRLKYIKIILTVE